jgi:hypothetical protein
MKVELIRYAIKSKVIQELYSRQASIYTQNYALYLGEDDEHIWLYPIAAGTPMGKTIPEVCFLSVSRFVKEDIIIYPDEVLLDHITDIPFGEMKHKGLSIFD